MESPRSGTAPRPHDVVEKSFDRQEVSQHGNWTLLPHSRGFRGRNHVVQLGLLLG